MRRPEALGAGAPRTGAAAAAAAAAPRTGGAAAAAAEKLAIFPKRRTPLGGWFSKAWRGEGRAAFKVPFDSQPGFPRGLAHTRYYE